MIGHSIATINTAALQHNFQLVSQLCPQQKIIPVIKADAYGHGSVIVARSLPKAEMFAVAEIAEAMVLREAGIKTAILVLEGFVDKASLDVAVDLQLEVVIYERLQLALLEELSTSARLAVWVMHNSGMNRLGFSNADFIEACTRLQGSPQIKHLRAMTHFASADDVQSQQTDRQLAAFNAVSESFSMEKSMAASAAILKWPETHADWVRPGIMLYGASPFAQWQQERFGLMPVMTVESGIISMIDVPRGESVGYNAQWTSTRDSRIAVVALGYADGYPRHMPTGTPVLINGQRAPLAGRVSMDMITVDITDLTGISVGDRVVLWGEHLLADEIAAAAGTIAYELFTGVGNRVSRRAV